MVRILTVNNENPLDRQATTPQDQIANLIEASRQHQTEVVKLRTRIQDDWSILNGRVGAQEKAIKGVKDLLADKTNIKGYIETLTAKYEGIKEQVEAIRQMVVGASPPKRGPGRPKKTKAQ